DFDSMRQINPVGRIPSLVLDDGEALIDSVAILDWLDQTVGPERALLPPGGTARRRALRLIALATGAIDKAGASIYERVVRPSARRWLEWLQGWRVQASGARGRPAAGAWPRARVVGERPCTR